MNLVLSLLLLSFTSTFAAVQPPATPTRPVVDQYHGVKVTDQYRWLEDSENKETQEWTKAQSQFAREYLDQVKDLPKIKSQLKKWSDFDAPVYYSLFYRAGMYFGLKSAPPKNQPLIVMLKSPNDLKSEKVIFDPNLSDPTGKTAIDFFDISYDGKLIAISLSQNGSEIGSLHLFQIANGKKLPDLISNVKKPTAGGDMAWLPDSSGFFYTRYPLPGERKEEDLNFYQQIYFHKIGQSTNEDTYVLGKDFPRIAEIEFGASPDGKYIYADVSNGDGGEHGFYLRNPNGEWKAFSNFKDNVQSFRLGFGDDLFFVSQKNAPKGQVFKTSLSKPDLSQAQLIIPESDVVIESVVATKSRLFTVDLVGGPSQIRMYDLNGKFLNTLNTEKLSSIRGLTRFNDESVMFAVNSYIHDAGYLTFDPLSKSAQNLKPKATAIKVKSPVKFDDIEVVREFATSKDGTKVPLNILYKKGLKKNSKNPTILYGYGGYGISLRPGMSRHLRLWFDHGGVYVYANLRGGGEFGEEWHLKGNLTRKQNVFDDFIASAEYLIQSKYTSPEYLAIEGRSNGGLLMGAALVQRPDLFRAVVAGVGIYDMLRVELDANGAFNVTEFGTVKDKEQFKALYAYSPIHNVKDKVNYPAVLLTTGAHDGRVNPLQSKKMAARLQAANAADTPILLMVDFGGGHGMGQARDQWVSDRADVYAFLFKAFGIKY